jgi:hypothetical protein
MKKLSLLNKIGLKLVHFQKMKTEYILLFS